jgi:hypothetical protein
MVNDFAGRGFPQSNDKAVPHAEDVAKEFIGLEPAICDMETVGAKRLPKLLSFTVLSGGEGDMVWHALQDVEVRMGADASGWDGFRGARKRPFSARGYLNSPVFSVSFEARQFLRSLLPSCAILTGQSIRAYPDWPCGTGF